MKEKKAAVKEFDDKKVELKENLIAELEDKKKMIENEKLTMELTGGERARVGSPVWPLPPVLNHFEGFFVFLLPITDSMEVKPIMTRKLRRRPNDPVPIPDKRRKPAPDSLYNRPWFPTNDC